MKRFIRVLQSTVDIKLLGIKSRVENDERIKDNVEKYSHKVLGKFKENEYTLRQFSYVLYESSSIETPSFTFTKKRSWLDRKFEKFSDHS